jgi:trimeric autotransporter adhesin
MKEHVRIYRKIHLFVFTFLFIAAIPDIVFAQAPANDDCLNAISRTSSTSCNTNGYSLNNATASAGIPGVPCVAGTHYDIWFKFTAGNAFHTATISNRGSNFTNPEVAIFDGTCAALVQLACGTTTATATGLTIGNVYYVRVSNVGAAAITSNGGFDICITNPGTPPTNDECSTAISRTSSTSCNNNGYSLRYATASAGIPGVPCVAGVHYDVWFSFTAVGTSHTATISNLSSGITNPEVSIFSGTCAALVQQACGTTTATATGLIIGTTYYVRISNVGTAVTSNGGFDICITHPNPPPANDNCIGATTLTPGYTCSSVTATLRNANNSAPTGACGGATATTTYDVWFTFQATSTTQAVTVGNLGSNLSSASTYVEMLSGTCAGPLTSLGCQAVSVTGGRLTLTTLTAGTFYFVRVYVVSNPSSTSTTSTKWNFDICVQQPPANDDCAGAVNLTPGAACTNTAGTLDLSTPSAAVPLGCFAAGTYYDVWYSFVATASLTHTITLGNLGSSFTAPRIQVYGGVCGALVPLPLGAGCPLVLGATTHTLVGLTPGTTYYVRIANFNVNPSGPGSVANFNICVTTAVNTPPANDLCSGAISLTSGTSCSNISGTILNATATGGLPACGNAGSPDVWYSFVAQSAFPVITLSGVGANLTTAAPRIQLFSGTCGTLTQLTGACVASPLNTATTPGGAGLTVGTIYYIRITTLNLAGPVAAGTYNYNICVTDPNSTGSAIIDYAKSYVNITDGTVGGTINPGDVLEIRATLVVNRNSTPAHRAIDSVAFNDTLRAGMGLAYNPGTIATRTNEGKIYKSFTDVSSDADAGWYITGGAGTDTTIQINMGIGAGRTARGIIRSSSKPSNFGNTCIIMATYRVTVNAAYGTKINYGGGAFTYRDSVTGVFKTINFPYDSLMVYDAVGICPNTSGQTNILGDEVNGTFGAPAASAGSQNRGTSPNTNYAYQALTSGGPQDYFYAVPNNTSGTNATNQTVSKTNPSATRVFNVWDITGDHTGAANPAKGNKPCDPTAPISASNPCGYMLVVNAAYRTDVAFSFNVSGACPSTYYEISTWVKNICSKCGCDSNGVGAPNNGALPLPVPYIPTIPAGVANFADSSGIRPNLAYEINGVDYYTTGDIPHLGIGIGATQAASDTLNTWTRKAFVYKTETTQTSFNLTIRNNAPGGGGNDWVLDDVTLRTCFPNMAYSPSLVPTICENNILIINDTIRSIFNNYVEYKWQRSSNGGVTWTDIAGTNATGTPTLVSGMYQYVATYTIPPAFTTASNTGDIYRAVVATTSSNLASSCNFSDPLPITVSIIPACGPPLLTDLLSVSGKLINDKARISWVTAREEGNVSYRVERSNNGINFTFLGIVDGYNNHNAEKNYYNLDDPQAVSGKAYYRIVVLSNQVEKKYSRTIELSLSETKNKVLTGVINPFYNELQYEISSPAAALAKVELIDNSGKTVIRLNQHINQGVNALAINNTGGIPTGIYLLRVTINGTVSSYRVLKGQR